MIKIKIALAQDLDGINHVTDAICADPNSHYKPPHYLQEDIEKSECHVTFVSINNKQIIGYLVLHSRNSFQNDKHAEFEMGVHPDHKRKGSGKALVESAIKYAEDETKLNQLIIKVSRNNTDAKKLYKKTGFITHRKEKMGEWMVKDINR